ncbi:MAG: hypothetical protein AAGF12_16495 [Myxococcota bacterium]
MSPRFRVLVMAAGIWGGSAGLACTEVPATQTLVFLYAQPDTAPNADELRITVSVDGEAVAGPRVDPVARSTALVATLPIVPRGDDPSRSFEVLAELLEGGNSVASLRVMGGYRENELRQIHARFDVDCVGVPDCGPGRTCRAGVCVASCYDSVSERVDDAFSLPRCGECRVCASHRCEARGDGEACGCPGDACSGGSCVVGEPLVDVDINRGHGCMLVARQVLCWGDARALGALQTSSAPIGLAVDFNEPIAVAAGGAGTCVLHRASGPVDFRSCWGFNRDSRLGVGSDQDPLPPTLAPEGDPAFTSIAGGLNHYCAISRSREVYCWGEDGGFVGAPDVWTEPMRMNADNDAGWIKVASNWQHSCALHEDGRVRCWGPNEPFPLGRSDPFSTHPDCVRDSAGTCMRGFTDVSVHIEYTLAVRNGELWGWGNNTLPGRLFSSDGWTGVARGGEHSCALRADGELFCWGSNDQGQLGLADVLPRTEPTPVGLFEQQRFERVFSARYTTCAIDSEGGLFCWGSNLADVFGGPRAPGLLGTNRASDVDFDPQPRRVCLGL